MIQRESIALASLLFLFCYSVNFVNGLKTGITSLPGVSDFHDICPSVIPRQSCRNGAHDNADEKFCAKSCRKSCHFTSNEFTFRLEDKLALSIPHEHAHYFKQTAVVGNRIRLSSVTDVHLISPSHLISMSYGAREIYLWHFNRSQAQATLLAYINATYKGRPTNVDLLDWDSGSNRVAASNFMDGSQSIYKIDIDKRTITHVDEFATFPIDGATMPKFCHSVKFVPSKPSLVIAVSVLPGSFSVGIFDTVTRRRIYDFSLSPAWHAQDSEVVNDQHLLVLYTTSVVRKFHDYDNNTVIDKNPNIHPRCLQPTHERSSVVSTRLELHRIDLHHPSSHDTMAALVIPNAHPDSLTLVDGLVYINDQHNDVVHVVELTMADANHPYSLKHLTAIGGFHMPHGVHVAFGMLAVTNYGDNTLKIMTLPDVRNIAASKEKRKDGMSGNTRNLVQSTNSSPNF